MLKKNDNSIIKIKPHFRFLCFLILTCEKKPFLGIYIYIYLSYPSNTIIKIREELDKKMTNILFAEEPCYSVPTAQPRFLTLSSIFLFPLIMTYFTYENIADDSNST